MKTRPKLIRVLTPPPLPSSSNIFINTGGDKTTTSNNKSNDLTTVAQRALTASLSVVPPYTASSSPFKIHAIHLHPVQPLVVYFLATDDHHDTPTALGVGVGVGGSAASSSPSAASSSIVVQNVHSRQVVWSTTLGDVAMSLASLPTSSTDNSSYDALTPTAEGKQSRMLKELGDVQRLEFVDPSTLYWAGYGWERSRQQSQQPDDDESGERRQQQQDAERWNYLLVQFKGRIVILSMRQPASSLVGPTTFHRFVVACITPSSLKAGGQPQSTSKDINISSNGAIVSPTSILVACDDGSIRLYDFKEKHAVVAVAMTSWPGITKGDFIVQILSVNPYPSCPDELYKNHSSSHNGIAVKVPSKSSTRPRAVVCLTKKGLAFLCPLEVGAGVGQYSLRVNTILPPIARMEGGSAPTSMAVQDEETSMDHTIMQYCPFRDLLLWKSPSKQKSKLFVWDISALFASSLDKTSSQQHQQSSTMNKDPILSVQFPYENISHSFYAGWLHESVPKESMTCAAVTKDGEFQICVAPLYNAASSPAKPFSAVTIQGVNLIHLVQRDLDLPDERPPEFKVQSITGLYLRDSSVFFVGTSIGILMVKMVDGNLVSFPGTSSAHLSANIGTMGRSILAVRGPQISYSPLEPEGGLLQINPIGKMDASKKVTVIYESPAPLHLPPEIHKRPVRLPPRFLLSPTRNFICCFWKEEMRYEVLDIANMLDRVSSRNPVPLGTGNSPVVASGNGVASFAWVGDEDVFALLYDPEQDMELKSGIDMSAPGSISHSDTKAKLKDLGRLKTYKNGVKSMAGTASKLKSLEGLRDLGKDTGKFGIGAVKGVTKLTLGTVKATGKATSTATAKTGKTMTMMAVGGKKGVSGVAKIATFGMWKKKSQDKKGVQGSLAGADEDEDDDTPTINTSPLEAMSEVDDADAQERALNEKLEKKFPWVELRVLVSSSTSTEGIASSTTVSNLGELTLRSGNRNPPTALFGGPVLLVGSKVDEQDEGLAYFYTKKKDQDEQVYVSSGPAFPCPDFVTWDDDGSLCAVVIHDRVSIYFSEEPNFVMLGSIRIGNACDIDVEIVSAKFIHGVLFCSTRSSIQCIFLGDLEGGVCHLDTYVLSSSDVALLPSRSIVSDYKSLCPPIIPMPLSHPEVLGYQNGSLVVSNVSGILAVPLGFPLLRIGTLVAAGPEHYPKAVKWFDAVPTCDHEVLASFLERRGTPELAIELPGLSLETILDMCMRYDYVDRLEKAIHEFGLDGFRAIDMGRGFSVGVFGREETGLSLIVYIGAYLLSHGRIELVRTIAAECITQGEKQDGLMLGLLINSSDAKRLVQRAVEDAADTDIAEKYIRDNILST